MNLSALDNGRFVGEEDVYKIIISECCFHHLPIMVFVNMTNVQFTCKLFSLIAPQIKKEIEDITPEEHRDLDRKTKLMYQAPLWLNDTIIKSMEDYKCADETIVNEKVKHVFVDIITDTISKSDIMEWSKEVGFNVYFTMFTWK